MAITQIIATLPAVLNDSETFYEDIAVRNNSLVTVSFPSINTWATQANALAVEVNDKAAQVAAQAVDGGYSQTYINTNFVGVNNAQTIAGIKTFSANPISSAAQSSSVNALTRRDFVTTLDAQNIKLTGNQTIAGIKTFSSFPVTPSSTPNTDYQVANKKYVDDNASDIFLTDFTGSNQSLGNSGYQKLPGGLIVQWIRVTSSISTDQTFSFPLTFSNKILGIATGGVIGSPSVIDNVGNFSVSAGSNSQFVVNRADNITGTHIYTVIAIGI